MCLASVPNLCAWSERVHVLISEPFASERWLGFVCFEFLLVHALMVQKLLVIFTPPPTQ